MPAGALRKQKQAQDDEGRDYCRCERPAERKATEIFWLVEEVSDRSPERTRQDEGGPEQ
jgi:hypothetical protein